MFASLSTFAVRYLLIFPVTIMVIHTMYCTYQMLNFTSWQELAMNLKIGSILTPSAVPRRHNPTNPLTVPPGLTWNYVILSPAMVTCYAVLF